MSQEPIIFKRSLIDNIRYGKITASDEECIQAAKEANIEKLIEKEKLEENKEEDIINKKINDKINENDNQISRGEKQRIAIAIIFLKNPSILLFDEATSSLDKINEVEVEKSLNKLANRKTSISIAHRLNTIENSDMIFVFENGKIVEKGKHEDLMKLQKIYYTLYKYSEYSN